MFSRIESGLTYGDSTGQMGVTDVSSGNQHFILAHKGLISSLTYTVCGRLLLSSGTDCKGNEVKVHKNVSE